MAVSSRLFPLFFKSLLNKETDLDTNTLKVMLLTSSYTYAATHQYKSDLTNEVTGTGYTAGGATLASVTVTTTVANSWATSRANSTAYTVGQIVRPATGNTFVYQCVTAGTSAGTIPTYPTVVGQTVTDGSVVWVCAGSAVVVVDATDPSWTSSTITARYAAYYDSTPGTDATRPLISLTDFGADVVSSSGTFAITIDPLGFATILPA